MIEAAAREDWKHLETKLRSYLARRLPRSSGRGSDLDDLVQETLLKVFRTRELRAAGRGAPLSHYGPFVYRVAKNVLIDHFRRRGRELQRFEDETRLEALGDANAESLEDRPSARTCDLGELARSLLLELPEELKTAVSRADLEGIGQKDLALAASLSLSGMKSRVQRGRAALRRSLEEICELKLDSRKSVVTCEPRGNACQSRCAQGGLGGSVEEREDTLARRRR